MRRIFFSFLILLTVFRGMVGDAMAYEMSSGTMQRMSVASLSIDTTESIALHADTMPVGGKFSSKNQAGMPCHDLSEEAKSSSAHACTSCQVCHSPALQSLAQVMESAKLQAPYAGQSAMVWVSADLTHVQKPPVS